MSGLELLQKVRDAPDAASLPVVMLTTRNNKEDIVSAMKAGINNYITTRPRTGTSWPGGG